MLNWLALQKMNLTNPAEEEKKKTRRTLQGNGSEILPIGHEM
jgi:hypothetical protein